ncbi:MAG: terminase large subunit domain-containing protein, partial [Candidatus Kapaibacterium sp.]
MANIPTNFAKIFTRNRYKRPRHIEYLEKKLVQVYNGEIDRLIITMPPRHGKSELTSKYFPAWWLLNNPAARIILVSYESQFASRWSMAAKEIYRRFRPGDMLKIDQQDYWLTPAGGFMNAIGVGGAITGKGADLIIVDDPVKNDEQALSGTYRNKTFSFFNSTLYTRLEPGGRIVIIQTRWHKDDLAGRLLEAAQSGDGDKWDVVNLPAIADGDCVLGREAGEALWPERFSLENIDKIKKQLGSYWFSALYQQDPISGEHQIINPDLWQYYSPDMIDEKPYIIQVWDTAFKSGEMNDYTACTTWICNRFGFFLIDLFHGKPAYPELKKQLEIQY